MTGAEILVGPAHEQFPGKITHETNRTPEAWGDVQPWLLTAMRKCNPPIHYAIIQDLNCNQPDYHSI